MSVFLAILLTILTIILRPDLLPKLQTNFLIPSITPSPAIISTVPKTAKPTITPITTWGVAVKISDHTYQMNVTNDASMGTPVEILQALNNYRIKYGVQPLTEDQKLCSYAQSRAELFNQIKGTDQHRGFIDYLDNQNGFYKLGYRQLGENSSYGYTMSGVHLIEFIYRASMEHNANQLDSRWDHGCVGVSDSSSNIIFATSPF